MKATLNHVRLMLLISFTLMAGAALYWGVFTRQALTSRPDNPRLVFEQQRIDRGDILAADGSLLAYSQDADGIFTRKYVLPAAAPLTGYYSFTFGTAGLENQFDEVLNGADFLSEAEAAQNALLNRAPRGGSVRSTLDISIQRRLMAALDGHSGAAVVLEARTGQVIALASTPTYDPNLIEAEWANLRDQPSAPLLNRATQAAYQPGGALQPFWLAASDDPASVLLQSWDGPAAMRIDGRLLPCASATPRASTLREALLWACPSPFYHLTSRIDARLLADLGLIDQAPVIITPLELAGQGQITVTPLAMARAYAALANDGLLPPVINATAVRSPGSEAWQPLSSPAPQQQMPSGAAQAITNLLLMAQHQGPSAAILTDLPPFTGAHTALALSGPASSGYTAWFNAFTSAQDAPDAPIYVVTVVIENADDVTAAQNIGAAALQAVLNQ